MELHIRKAGKAAILDLKGPLTLGKGEGALRESVEKLRDAGTKHVAINLAGVAKMDSSGIGALMHVFTTMKRVGGNCRFFAPPKKVLQLLKMVCLDTVLDLDEDEASALAKF